MAEEYAGDVSPKEAWDILERDPRSVLLDVRTEPEWEFVGVPDLTKLERRTILVSWQDYPDMHPNPTFAKDVEARGISPDQTLLIICRSGVRSRHAAIALTARGYKRCLNVACGFEGSHDKERHRGACEGWKAIGLPWLQE